MWVRVLPGVPISTGMWFNPNSRGSRLRIWQPWGCKSLHAHQFRGDWLQREQQTRAAQDRTALGVQVSQRRPIWNVNGTSEPGLGANECVPSGKWCKSTTFRHSNRVDSRWEASGESNQAHDRRLRILQT